MIIRKIKSFFQEEKELYLILSKINKYFSNKKIILIGNARNVLKKRIGNKIDKFDIVVRFNGTPTKMYKNFIGVKTDMMACNEEICLNWCKKGFFTNDSVWIKNGKYIKFKTSTLYKRKKFENYNNNCTFVVIENKKTLKKIKKFKKAKKIIFFNNSLNHILRYKMISNYNYFKKISSYLRGSKLTIGAILIFLLKLAKINFYIHGFDLKKTPNNYYQYYHNYKHGKTDHEFKEENNILLDLLKKKQIKFI